MPRFSWLPIAAAIGECRKGIRIQNQRHYGFEFDGDNPATAQILAMKMLETAKRRLVRDRAAIARVFLLQPDGDGLAENSLRLFPSSVAAAFALRNKGPGSSTVVFMKSHFLVFS
jgi:hypothetical protein